MLNSVFNVCKIRRQGMVNYFVIYGQYLYKRFELQKYFYRLGWRN